MAWLGRKGLCRRRCGSTILLLRPWGLLLRDRRLRLGERRRWIDGDVGIVERIVGRLLRRLGRLLGVSARGPCGRMLLVVGRGSLVVSGSRWLFALLESSGRGRGGLHGRLGARGRLGPLLGGRSGSSTVRCPGRVSSSLGGRVCRVFSIGQPFRLYLILAGAKGGGLGGRRSRLAS